MPDTRTKPSIADRIFDRQFGDREVIEALDAMSIDAVIRALYSTSDDGTPYIHRKFAPGAGYWRPGIERPALADDDPAVMQAIGRCAAYRLRVKLPGLMPLVSASHPRECAWCDYPMAEMLLACDWATHRSDFLVTERLTWWQWPQAESGYRGLSYSRSGLSETYLEPDHAALWALPADEREARIAAAQYPDTIGGDR